jgi:hypothetical protein
METTQTCQKAIKPTQFTNEPKRKCGNKATHIYGGLPFCESHFNRCMKHEKHQLEQRMKQGKIK